MLIAGEHGASTGRKCVGAQTLSFNRRHGPHTNCSLTFSKEFVLKYMELKEGSEGRKLLQRRFGKGNLEKLVRQFKEDKANMEWLEKSTMACPGCGVHTEKSVGCNHVCHSSPLHDRLVIYALRITDDVRKVFATFLLSVWRKTAGVEPVRAFLAQGSPVLPEAVRR